MKKIVNNPHLTAIERTSISFPTRWLKQNNLLKGEILDFGCGFGYDTDQLKEQGYDITGYDNYYRPDYPEKRFNTILCNYVLNVLEPNEQAEVLMSVSELLKPAGKAPLCVHNRCHILWTADKSCGITVCVCGASNGCYLSFRAESVWGAFRESYIRRAG